MHSHKADMILEAERRIEIMLCTLEQQTASLVSDIKVERIDPSEKKNPRTITMLVRIDMVRHVWGMEETE